MVLLIQALVLENISYRSAPTELVKFLAKASKKNTQGPLRVPFPYQNVLRLPLFRRDYRPGLVKLLKLLYYTSMLSKRTKTKVIGEHAAHDKDTGSAGVQIAVLSKQIDELTSHLKKHAKDNHSRRGLLKMVSQRRKLLSYMKKKEPEKYEKLLKKLDLKK